MSKQNAKILKGSISETINLIDSTIALRRRSNMTHMQFTCMAAGRHLEKSIWRHNSAVLWPILIKFGTSVLNAIPWRWMNRSKWNRK